MYIAGMQCEEVVQAHVHGESKYDSLQKSSRLAQMGTEFCQSLQKWPRQQTYGELYIYLLPSFAEMTGNAIGILV